jgi:hypothetical protein
MTARRFSAARTSVVAIAAGAAIAVMSANGLVGGGHSVEGADDPDDRAKLRVPGHSRLSHGIRVPLWRIWIR